MSAARSLMAVNALMGINVALGFVNSIVIAAVFGLTGRVDAYYAALMLPGLFMILCVDYLGKNFLPVFSRARAIDMELASQLTSSVVTIVALLAALLAGIFTLASKPIFSALLPGLPDENIDLVAHYFLIMAPTLLFKAATTFHEYICQYEEKYVTIIAVHTLLPVANLAALLGLSHFIGEYALPVGYLLGHFLVFILMARIARYRYRPRLRSRREWEGTVFTNSGIVMASGMIARSRVLIWNYLASLLGSGTISALAFARRLAKPIEERAMTGVRMIAFSRAARLREHQDQAQLTRLYRITLRVAFLSVVPAAVWMTVNTDGLVHVLFARGKFTEEMADLVSLALLGVAPGIVFMAANPILSNAFYAMEKIWVPTIVMPLATVLYLLLAAVLSQTAGILGLAAAGSLWAVTIFVVLLWKLAVDLKKLNAAQCIGWLSWYVLLAATSYGLPAILLSRFEAAALVALVGTFVVGSALYLMLLLLTGDEGFKYVRRQLRELRGGRCEPGS